MVNISRGCRDRGVAELFAYDPNIYLGVCQVAGSRVTKVMDMNMLSDFGQYAVILGDFSDVRTVKPSATVTCEKEIFRIVFPGGYPIVELPARVQIDSDASAFVSLTISDKNGTIYRVDIRRAQREDLAAPKLAPKCQKKDQPVPAPRVVKREGPEESFEFRRVENFGRE